jgi:RNA polymerase sigma factor (sigma-70 family)
MQTIAEFDTFFHEHYDKAMRIAAKMVGHDDGEDVIQIAFLAVWNNRHKIDDHAGYLFGSIKNRCLDVIKRKTSLPINDLEFIPDEIKATESMDIVCECMKRIRPAYKRIIELTLMGYSQAEIAALMHVSVQTVKNSKSLAIAEMKKYLK